jgi:hypothetical protein
MLKTIQKIRHLAWKGMDEDIRNRVRFLFRGIPTSAAATAELFIEYAGKFLRIKTGNVMLQNTLTCSPNFLGFFQ